MFDKPKSFYDNDGIKVPCKRIYHPYWEWEDWKCGIYCGSENKEMIKDASLMLLSAVDFYQHCLMVLNKWPKSCQHRLTNNNINRKAWIGHSAAYFYCGSNKASTRRAYLNLPIAAKKTANNVAKVAIEKYLLHVSKQKPTTTKQLELWKK